MPSRSFVLLLQVRRRRRRREQEDRRRFFRYIQERNLETATILTLLMMHMGLGGVGNVTRPWSLPKSCHWWQTIVLQTWDDSQFLANFRMNKDTFNYILDQVRPFITRENTNFRRAIPPDQRLAIALWRLATNVEYRTIAGLFGVGLSTVCVIVLETCQALIDTFRDRIAIPDGQRLDNCLNRFAGRFPQAVAAIDGSHIPIRAPRNDARDYFNRKGFYSIILQAVVDSYGQFIDLNIGWPGSVHDARVFSNSSIYQKLQDETLFRRNDRVIFNTTIPMMILGDPAYPLMPNLMKPYSDNGRLTPSQIRFNNRLSSCRITVEHAFGRLKGRWRILSKTMDHELENVCNIVLTCCILHNVVEVQNNPFLDHWNIENDQPPAHPGNHHNGQNIGANVPLPANQPGRRATIVRDTITRYFDA